MMTLLDAFPSLASSQGTRGIIPIYSSNASSENEQDQMKALEHAKAVHYAYENQTLEIGTHFSHACLALGILAVLFNIMVLVIIFGKHKCVISNVFYLLLINFTIVDCLTGFCLIMYAKYVATDNLEIDQGLLASSLKGQQIMILIMRFCHLITILNLLMLTLNEFVFIKYPLRYHSTVTKKTALLSICFSWILCMVLTTASTLERGRQTRVFVDVTEYSSETENDTSIDPMGNFTNFYMRLDESSQDVDLHYIVSFVLMAFCTLCLAAVIVCYTIFFRLVKKIIKTDASLAKEANRRPGEYRYSIDEASVNDCFHRTGFDSAILPTTHSRPHEDRRIKRQLVRRYKYVIVLGLVIFVYMLYLFSYSTIQVFQYIIILGRSRQTTLTSQTDRHKFIIRWSMQLMVGLHSVFQPLCCFRMKEFRLFLRKLLCCQCKKGGTSSSIYYSERSMSGQQHKHNIDPTKNGESAVQHDRNSLPKQHSIPKEKDDEKTSFTAESIQSNRSEICRSKRNKRISFHESDELSIRHEQ